MVDKCIGECTALLTGMKCRMEHDGRHELAMECSTTTAGNPDQAKQSQSPTKTFCSPGAINLSHQNTQTNHYKADVVCCFPETSSAAISGKIAGKYDFSETSSSSTQCTQTTKIIKVPRHGLKALDSANLLNSGL